MTNIAYEAAYLNSEIFNNEISLKIIVKILCISWIIQPLFCYAVKDESIIKHFTQL